MDRFILLLLLLLLLDTKAMSSSQTAPTNSNLFREYIGGEDKGTITFSDVPINSNVEFHFILSFAVDYDTSFSPPTPNNGRFKPNWNSKNLSPAQVSSIKAARPNVKLAMSLGGDTIGDNHPLYFDPKSINSWVSNAMTSITKIARKYQLDGLDIDYEHFKTDPDTFTECIGRLLFYLKQQKIISFASIAPYQNETVQEHYLALWRKYGYLIDYVNFQFYAYDQGTNVAQFLEYFNTQESNYRDGKVLVSLTTDGNGGLSPKDGFFDACNKLKGMNKLHGIFIWSADDSKKGGFRFEQQAQNILANSTESLS